MLKLVLLFNYCNKADNSNKTLIVNNYFFFYLNILYFAWYFYLGYLNIILNYTYKHKKHCWNLQNIFEYNF